MDTVTLTCVRLSDIDISDMGMDQLSNSNITWGGAAHTLVPICDIGNVLTEDKDLRELENVAKTFGDEVLVDLEH